MLSKSMQETLDNIKSGREWINGMPPVGCVCEARYIKADGEFVEWFKCRFQGGYLHKIWIYDTFLMQDRIIPAHELEFRPIKNESLERKGGV